MTDDKAAMPMAAIHVNYNVRSNVSEPAETVEYAFQNFENGTNRRNMLRSRAYMHQIAVHSSKHNEHSRLGSSC